MSDVLPAGALDALKEGGTAAFDRAIEADRQATQQALTTARNSYNDSKRTAPSQTERDAVRTAHIERGLRENPGRSRTEIEAAFDAEAKAAREKWDAAHPPAPKPALPDETFDLTELPVEELRAMAGTTQPVLPSQYKDIWSGELEGELLNWGLREQIPSETLQALMEFYVDTSLLSADQSMGWAEEQFHHAFEGRLSKAQRDILVQFWRQDVLGQGESVGQEDGEGA